MKTAIACTFVCALAACSTTQPNPERAKQVAAVEGKGWGFANRILDIATVAGEAYAERKAAGYRK